MTRKRLREIATSRTRKTWRGKDLKKLVPIPWSVREVVFTCSNGWTIEKIAPKDNFIEGVLMGHCMGIGVGISCGAEGDALSLRDELGIPHVTIDYGKAHGRCNGTPPDRYMALIHEWNPDIRVRTGYGKDEDKEYHEKGVLTDKDYRDVDTTEARYWRRKEYYEKRKLEQPAFGVMFR